MCFGDVWRSCHGYTFQNTADYYKERHTKICIVLCTSSCLQITVVFALLLLLLVVVVAVFVVVVVCLFVCLFVCCIFALRCLTFHRNSALKAVCPNDSSRIFPNPEVEYGRYRTQKLRSPLLRIKTLSLSLSLLNCGLGQCML